MDNSIFDGVLFSDLFDRLKNQPRLAEIERLLTLDRETFLRDVASKGYPVVVKTAAGNSSRTATLDSLRKLYGTRSIKVRVGDYGAPLNYLKNRELVEMPLGEYLDSLFESATGIPPYAGNQPVPVELIPELEIASPPFAPPLGS